MAGTPHQRGNGVEPDNRFHTIAGQSLRWCAREGRSERSLRCSAEPSVSESLVEAFVSGVSRPTAAKPNIHLWDGRIGGGVGTKFRVLTWGGLLASDMSGSRQEGNDEMTKGQEESDDLVVPQGRRKAVPTDSLSRGGKEVTAGKEVEQLEMFRETADSPRGDAEESGAGRPAFLPHALPKSRTTKRGALPAVTMTMEEVANEQNLRRAFEQVAANKGAPGADRQSVAEVQQHLDDILPPLREALLDESYRPGLIRRVWIPKAGGGQRGLGIPNVIDRIVQQAVHRVLSPHFEQSFHDASHGFRPGRSCHTAIAAAAKHLEDGYEWLVDLDLEKFFDRVHHERLLARLQRHGVEDPRLLRLIRQLLKAKVVMPDGVVVSTEEGTPQGGPLSPLLSNIVLDELDREFERRGYRFVRYADDCNIYVRSERAGHRVMASTSCFIERRLRLKVNAEKSAVAKPALRHFVGFSLQKTQKGEASVRLSRRSTERIRRKIVELTPRNWGDSIQSMIERLNQYLVGWMAFFKIISTEEARYGLKILDSHIRRRLRALILRQKKRKLYIIRWFIRQRRVRVRDAMRDVYGGHRSLWALSITASAHKAMSTRYFEQLGLVSLQQRWRTLQPRTAIAPAQLELSLG
jgi:RNA-directed DNA polymerase